RAGALARAAARGVAAEAFDAADPAAIPALLARHDVELVVLAGYLKLVPPPVARALRGRMLNVHPSLLPAFGGRGMHGARVHQAVIASGARVSGATVHFVDEAYDRGPIAAQWPVPVFEEDSAETLAARVLRVEHHLLPRVVDAVAAGTLALDDDGRVRGAFLVGNPGESFALRHGDDALPASLDAALTR
ncbi:MAG: Phosphoribosylglycinamide formyltransferase, partial [uncultured Gemmatimonadaceae bacterium]